MTITVAYPTQLFSLSSPYPKKPVEGPLQIPLTLNFTPSLGASGVTGYTVNLSNAGSQQGSGFSQLCTVFVDNSQSPGTTTIKAIGTNLSVAVPPYARGYYPIQASNLNLSITNNSTTNCTVYVGCFNYVVNPQSDILAASTLGDMDAQIVSRIGNTAGVGQFDPAPIGFTTLGGFASANATYPYYYLTGFDVTWLGLSGTTASYATLVDCDASNNILNTFATFFVLSSESVPRMAINRSGICVSGTGTLKLQIGNTVSGIIAINWYGGRSKSAITAAQFAVVT